MSDQQNHYERKLNYEIDAWDLKLAIESGEDVTVIDTRSRDAYIRGHIPHALNIPHREMSAETTDAICKDALIVTYCDGVGCNASTNGALNMVKLGFRVRELIGGLDWWIRDGHPVHTIADTVGIGGCGCG